MINGTSSQEVLSENGGGLEPGHFASPGVCVVVHRNPAHACPHEIAITTQTMLPECEQCSGVRFNFKCVLAENKEKFEFFAQRSMVLTERVRSEAEELHIFAAKSRFFLEEAELFLTEFNKTVYTSGLIANQSRV